MAVRPRPVTRRVLHPREELRGASLRFNPGKIKAGLRAAREASWRPDAGSVEVRTARKRCPPGARPYHLAEKG
jgi:hypothetical protein